MHHKYLLLLCLFYSSISNSLKAQDSTPCFICKGHLHTIKDQPYQVFSVKKEAAWMASSFGLGLVAYFLPEPTPFTPADINLLNPTDINSFDRSATTNSSVTAKKASDVFLFGVLVLPTIFLSNHSTRQDLIPLGAMSVEVVLLNYAFTSITKKIAKRTRPLVYNSDFPLEEKLDANARSSFYSGHTSHTAALSFFMAKVMTDYHPDASKGFKIGVWTFAAAVPTITGYLRVRAGKHFPTDTIIGGITGGLVGILVPHLHRKKKPRVAQKVKIDGSIGIGMATLGVQF